MHYIYYKDLEEKRQQELEAEKSVLEEELNLKQKDLEAAKALAEGKMLLEDTSAQYLTDLRANLIKYFIINLVIVY